MKKYLVLSAALLVLNCLKTNAQAYEAGQFAISGGYGFPNFTRTIFNVIDGVSKYESSVAGPVYGKFEYAVNDVVGFGVNIAYTHAVAFYTTSDAIVDSFLYDTKFTYDSYSILGRLNFHFGNSDVVDPYAGIGMGYRTSIYNYTSDDPELSGADFNGFNHFGVDLTIGARFYLTENIGIYGELGVAKSPLQVGIVAKF